MECHIWRLAVTLGIAKAELQAGKREWLGNALKQEPNRSPSPLVGDEQAHQRHGRDNKRGQHYGIKSAEFALVTCGEWRDG
jgi:hypothetical protein